jgi:hypothetical protein
MVFAVLRTMRPGEVVELLPPGQLGVQADVTDSAEKLIRSLQVGSVGPFC